MPWFYISLANEEKWVGGIFVEAETEGLAFIKASSEPCSDGCEAMIAPWEEPPEHLRNRLLTVEDVLSLSADGETAWLSSSGTIKKVVKL